MHADRFNRFALTVFGLIVLLAGAATMAMSVGAFGKKYSHETLFHNFISRYIGAQGEWFWPAAAGVSLIVTLLALRWIVALLVSTDRAGVLELPGERRRGRTELTPAALSTAVCAEIKTYHGVDSAKARVVGDSDSPQLVVEVNARRGTDIADLRHRIEDEALAHARAAMGQPEMAVRLDIAVSRAAVDRV